MAIYKISTAKASGHTALKGILRYVLNPVKTPSQLLGITGHFGNTAITKESVYNSFIENKKGWNKDSGRMYTHAIISFHEDENITPQQVKEFAEDFSRKTYPGYQTLIVVHEDKGHLHAHLVVDTVSYMDGKKLHCTRQELDRQHKICTALCKERGFRVMQKGYHFDGTEINESYGAIPNRNKYYVLKRGNTKDPQGIDLFKLLAVLIYALLHGHGFIGFVTIMNNNLWRVRWKPDRQHITFVSMESGRQFRTSNIEKTFGNRFKNIFGEDFILDREHISEILSIPERERKLYYTEARKMLDKIEKAPYYTKVSPWKPPRKKKEQYEVELRRKQKFYNYDTKEAGT